jgi:hypothetical protein
MFGVSCSGRNFVAELDTSGVVAVDAEARGLCSKPRCFISIGTGPNSDRATSSNIMRRLNAGEEHVFYQFSVKQGLPDVGAEEHTV